MSLSSASCTNRSLSASRAEVAVFREMLAQRDVSADRESVSNQMPRYWRKTESKPSSSSKMEGFFKMARAMATLCFWPPLSVMPRSAQQGEQSVSGSQHKTHCLVVRRRQQGTSHQRFILLRRAFNELGRVGKPARSKSYRVSTDCQATHEQQ